MIDQQHSAHGPEGGASRDWARLLTIAQAVLLGVAALLGGFFGVVYYQQSRVKAQTVVSRAGGIPPRADGAPNFRQGGRGFGGVREETKLVARFDTDGDARLNAAERKAARAWLTSAEATEAGFGRGGRRGGGRRFEAAEPGRRLSPDDVKPIVGVPLYDPASLRTIFLQFESADWEPELEAFFNSDVEVPATVTVDGRVYKDVGVHFRGASSYSMVPSGSKRSLNLSFDYAHEDQRLGGYGTLNLLNANSDPTFLRAVLYADIARAYIPAPRVNHVRVAINGESWGVYVNAQQFNRDFLREHYGTDDGPRWKVPGSPRGRGGLEYLGNDVAAYKRIYEIKTKDTPKSWRDLIELTRVLNETPVEKLEAALQPILDVDATLKFLALDVALVNTDGYWTRASDYNIYQDAKGRFHIIPHDINEAMMDGGGGGGGGPRAGTDLDPLVGVDDSSKPLRSRLLAVPALRARYLSYVRDIASTWLDWKKVGPLAAQYRSLIAAEVAADTRKLYSTAAFTAGVEESPGSLRSFMDRRRAFLLAPPR